jgi:hypothetical protein
VFVCVTPELHLMTNNKVLNSTIVVKQTLIYHVKG